jgi:DNA-binding response OmpR family regulator
MDMHTTNLGSVPDAVVDQPVVMLVDDSEMYRRRTAAEIEACGYTVLEASDGQQALIASRDVRPDVFVTDLQMPHIDGLQLCRALRELRAFDDVPLVVSTASPNDDSRVTEIDQIAGLTLVHKPIDGYELAALLDELLLTQVSLSGSRQTAAVPVHGEAVTQSA